MEQRKTIIFKAKLFRSWYEGKTRRNFIKTPKFSLIIPTSGRVNVLSDNLKSIAKQEIVKNQFEVIVVSNPANGKVKELVESIGDNFKYMSSPKRNANWARNLGAQSAMGKYFIFLDDDTFLPKSDFLIGLELELQGLGADSVLCGRYLSEPTMKLSTIVYNWISNTWLCKFSDKSLKNSMFLAGAVCVPRLAFEQGASFCHISNGACEEFVLSQKLRDLDYDLVLFDGMNVYHQPPKSFLGTLKTAFRHGQSKYIFDKKINKTDVYSFLQAYKLIYQERQIIQGKLRLGLSYVYMALYYLFVFLGMKSQEVRENCQKLLDYIVQKVRV